ncbi:MAG: threonine synthase, partial [Methylobacterium sp.]|nr:threonine synthase [Methylobacterium sp.]
ASVPLVVLATAAPAKLPDAIRAITGLVAGLPPRLAHLMTDPERMVELPNALADLEAHIRAKRWA